MVVMANLTLQKKRLANLMTQKYKVSKRKHTEKKNNIKKINRLSVICGTTSNCLLYV